MPGYGNAKTHGPLAQKSHSCISRESSHQKDSEVSNYVDKDAYADMDSPEMDAFLIKLADEAGEEGFIGSERTQKLREETFKC